jgi:hypothetical protein
MHMKRPLLALLLATTAALTSCETAHDAAVAGFRVIDAPHQYMRRQLGLDQQDTTTTTSSTTTVQTNQPPPNDNVYQQQQQPPPPPPRYRTETVEVQQQAPPPPPPHHVVVTERTRVTTPAPTPTPPRVTSRTVTTKTQSHVSQTTTPPPPRTEVSEKGNLPYAKPVPGKAGYVFSPYDKNGGYVDVTGFAPGSKVKDPYSGKVFLVP